MMITNLFFIVKNTDIKHSNVMVIWIYSFSNIGEYFEKFWIVIHGNDEYFLTFLNEIKIM